MRSPIASECSTIVHSTVPSSAGLLGLAPFLDAVSFDLQAVGHGRGHGDAKRVGAGKLDLIAEGRGDLHHVFLDIGDRADDDQRAPRPFGNRLHDADGPRDERKRRGQRRTLRGPAAGIPWPPVPRAWRPGRPAVGPSRSSPPAIPGQSPRPAPVRASHSTVPAAAAPAPRRACRASGWP